VPLIEADVVDVMPGILPRRARRSNLLDTGARMTTMAPRVSAADWLRRSA
jgi:hypothetical protein